MNSNGEPVVLPPGVPELARPLLEEIGYFSRDKIAVGDYPPVILLKSVDGGYAVSVGGRAEKPKVLIFGSYT